MTGAELRELRQSAGLSVKTLAARLRVAPYSVYRWEEGRVGITPSRADHIRRAVRRRATVKRGW